MDTPPGAGAVAAAWAWALGGLKNTVVNAIRATEIIAPVVIRLMSRIFMVCIPFVFVCLVFKSETDI
jgi:hypothetical protein